MRGKDSKRPLASMIMPGSPPLARERPTWGLKIWEDLGITPACAGKTKLNVKVKLAKGDHPRLRGKDFPNLIRSNATQGSPPLARERLPFRQLHSSTHGITPACAGKTQDRARPRLTFEDHPRLRGKDPTVKTVGFRPLGSPPLARERQ